MMIATMNKYTTFVISMLLAALFSGCSLSAKNVPPDYKLGNDKGIVVLSLTTSGECGYALFVDIRSMDKKYKSTIGLQDMLEGRDWNRKTNDCSVDNEDYSGRLNVIALPPGVYEMYKLTGMSRYQSYVSENNFSIQFKVKANSVTYIGNAHFAVKKHTFEFQVSDKRNRDLPMLERKYPQLPKEYIIDILEDIEYLST